MWACFLSAQKEKCMRVAVCLTGYVRTFVVPEVHEGIEALRRSLDGAALFAVVSNDAGDTFKGQAQPVDERLLAAARARVQIVEWRVVPHADQYGKLAYCAAMLDVHEQNVGAPFEWVARARPDGLYWPASPGWLAALNRSTVYQSSNSGDVLWFVPRHAVASMVLIGGDPCCGALPTRFFACGCDIVRTDVASATIARIGLVPTSKLGNRLDRPDQNQWSLGLAKTRARAFLPGTGRGITAERLFQRPNASTSRAYTLLDHKPWTAG